MRRWTERSISRPVHIQPVAEEIPLDVLHHILNFSFALRVLFDQDSIVCVSENAGDIIYTYEFEKFRQECGLSIRMCRGADPDRGATLFFSPYSSRSCFTYRDTVRSLTSSR